MPRMLLLLLPLFTLFTLTTIPAQARRQAQVRPSQVDEQEVLRDLEKILDLWRDGRYAELYERTAGGREGKERFAKKLASAPRRPACCWEKLQEARVTLKGDRAATVHAKLGFEGAVAGTEYLTKSIKLKREESAWVISQADLLSLADLGKRRGRYKYLPIQPK